MVKKLADIGISQSIRFKQKWDEYLKPLNDKPHLIRKIPLRNEDKERFLNDIDFRIDILKIVKISLVDGYYSIKFLLQTLYNRYLNDSELFNNDFSEPDRMILRFLIAKEILGTLMQYHIMEHETVPKKYSIIARTYTLIKLQGQTDKQIFDNMKKIYDSTELSFPELIKIMDEIVSDGIVNKMQKDGNNFYKLNTELNLSKVGEEKYNYLLRSLVTWPVNFWRSYYNIRELNITPNEDVKYRDYLISIIKRSATQGFTAAYFVFENLIIYYEKIKEGSV